MSLKNFLVLSILFLAFSLGFSQRETDEQQDRHKAQTESHEAKNHEEDTHGEEGKDEEGHHDAHGEGEEQESVSETIIHHILDNHNWHITDLPGGGEISIELPWIVYTSETGLVYAPDGEALVEKGIVAVHEKPYVLKEGYAEKVHVDHHGMAHLSEEEIQEYTVQGAMVIDFSITKTVLQMILVGLILLIVMASVARAYARREGQAPQGLQSFVEPIIVFVRDEVARPYLDEKAVKRLLPYLLTLFFFIWFANLFGLMPFNSNIAGNISFTAALAVLTFIITQVNASKDHWKHVFNTPGVPWWLKFGIPLMPVVEFIGLFTKPFALAVRLFANITAGHFMVLGLISLIFIMGNNGENVGAAFGIAPLSFLFTLIIFFLEMIVAIIQPFIFTLLTAVFVGMAMETHDDHH